MTKQKTHVHGQEQTPIINGVFSPSTALLQMLDHFGDQLSLSDWMSLHDQRFHLETTLEGWASVTENLAIYISEDHVKAEHGEIVTGLYATTNQSTPQLLTLASRAFEEISALLKLDDMVMERINELGGAK